MFGPPVPGAPDGPTPDTLLPMRPPNAPVPRYLSLAATVLLVCTIRCGGIQRSVARPAAEVSAIRVESTDRADVSRCARVALRGSVGSEGVAEEVGGVLCQSSGRAHLRTRDYRFGSDSAPAKSIRLCAVVEGETLRFEAGSYSVAFGRDDGCSVHGGAYTRYQWESRRSRGYFESLAVDAFHQCISPDE